MKKRMDKKGQTNTSWGVILVAGIALVGAVLVIIGLYRGATVLDPRQVDLSSAIIETNCKFSSLIGGEDSNNICFVKMRSSKNVYFTCGHVLVTEGRTFEGSDEVKEVCRDRLAEYTQIACTNLRLKEFADDEKGFEKVYVDGKKCMRETTAAEDFNVECAESDGVPTSADDGCQGADTVLTEAEGEKRVCCKSNVA